MSYFSINLKQLRSNNGITQEKLAQYLNLKRASISGYETGRKEPDYDKLILISDYFKVSIDFLLKEDSNLTEDTSTYLGENINLDDIRIIDILHSKKFLYDIVFSLSHFPDDSIELLNNFIISLLPTKR